MSEPWVHRDLPPGERDGLSQRSNPFAIPAFVVAVLTVVGSVVLRVLGLLLPSLAERSGMSLGQLVGIIDTISIVDVVLAVIAAGLGAAGVNRRDAPRGLAAAALGIGITVAALYLLGRISTHLVAGMVYPR